MDWGSGRALGGRKESLGLKVLDPRAPRGALAASLAGDDFKPQLPMCLCILGSIAEPFRAGVRWPLRRDKQHLKSWLMLDSCCYEHQAGKVPKSSVAFR